MKDAMDVDHSWPLTKAKWFCKETGEHARSNPKDPSIIGCLSCNFRTRYPYQSGHFKVEKVSDIMNKEKNKKEDKESKEK